MFTNISSRLQNNPAHLHYGVAVTDIDGDGQFEVFVAGFGFPNRVLKWDGKEYLDIAEPLLADASRRAIGVAAGDIDGDGREELYILNTDTYAGQKHFADRLFDFNGDTWADLFSLTRDRSLLNLTAGRSVIAVDRSGDGRYGFYVATYGGPTRFYEMDDDNRLHDVAAQAGLDLLTGGRSALALPFFSGGMDIFAGNELGANFFFRSRGDGVYDEIAEALGIDDPREHARGAAALDADGDGRFDLVVGNWEGPHRLFLQREDTWIDATPDVMAKPSRVRTVIAADFDNDGYEEIYFNNIGEENRLFGWRDDTWVRLDMGEGREPFGLGTGAAVGDFNNDGRLELLVAHGETNMQPLRLYATPQNDHHWLRVLPLTVQGAPARGAVVTLTAGSRTQRRAIDAGSGYLCQMEPVAHFGLGTLGAVETVSIRWPDGTATVLTEPAVDRLHTVAYAG